MPGELDQISLQIGRLLSSQEAQAERGSSMLKKLDDISQKVTTIGGVVENISESHEELKRQVNSGIVKDIDDLKALKNRGLGIIAAVSVIAGSAAAAIGKMIAKASAIIAGP